MTKKQIAVVDLFAGPGGLGEGFSSVKTTKGVNAFEVKTSIEKDPVAHRTLTLRAIFRSLKEHRVPESYYDYIRGDISREKFMASPEIKSAMEKAEAEAKCLELGQVSERVVDNLIRNAIEGSENWVLIGGPPCQAYSLAGRSRRINVDPNFEDDPKHFLYREYLRIIRKFEPPVFVMENVKGMLSSTHQGEGIFGRIMKDLSKPSSNLRYEIRSFVSDKDHAGLSPSDYTIRAEDYGVPQMRHRVILLGIRQDLQKRKHDLLVSQKTVGVRDVIGGLPAIRSGISREADSDLAWASALVEAKNSLKGWNASQRNVIEELMHKEALLGQKLKRNNEAFIRKDIKLFNNLPTPLAEWLHDPRLGGVCQHEARSHMRTDLHRYLFASCYADIHKASPKLANFPPKLLPDHRSANDDSASFADRFRVQIYGKPSTTIVSHIAKDGHYYIHPDPRQCRSLTVREAARLQTFPDNYFFEGNRTQQYHQVGNAVPPFLAKQLGETVARFFGKDIPSIDED